MSEKPANVDVTADNRPDDSRAPAPREAWATPKVLSSERFGSTSGPPDGDPDEATGAPGYGPFS